MLRLFLGAGLLLLAACQSAPPEAAPPVSPVAEAPPPTPPPTADAVGIALDGEGLRLVVEPSGSTRLLAFGAGRAEVTSVLETAGHPVTDEGTNAECGAGPLAFASVGDGLSLLFQDEAFVGWSTDSRTGGGAGLATMAGVGVGSPRADLESAYAAEVRETTLGTEFFAGGLGGILSGPGPDADVTNLWAGTPCVFR